MRALIIGYGSIGQRHYQILRNRLGEENVSVVSRRDIDLENSYFSVDEVSDIKEYDLFIIASKTIEHFTDLKALNKLVSNKIILVEKPLTHIKFEPITIQNQIIIGYNLRFHPLVRKAKEFLQNQKIYSARFYAGQYLPTWRPNTDYRLSYSAKLNEGGGILLDYSHDIDLIFYLIGELSYFKTDSDRISDLEIEADDYFSMIAQTSNGTQCALTLDSISKIQKREFSINTKDFTLQLDLIKNTMIVVAKDGEIKEYNCTTNRNTTYDSMYNDIMVENYNNFAQYEYGLKLVDLLTELRTDSCNKEWNNE